MELSETTVQALKQLKDGNDLQRDAFNAWKEYGCLEIDPDQFQGFIRGFKAGRETA